MLFTTIDMYQYKIKIQQWLHDYQEMINLIFDGMNCAKMCILVIQNSACLYVAGDIRTKA